jgi:glycerol-3-phosphate dehydrogenase (NAD(P)+)
MMKIAVIGAGAFGTALAIRASQSSARHHVSLWSRNSEHRNLLGGQRENVRYLPGFGLPSTLAILEVDGDSLHEQLKGQDLVVVATPMSGLRSVLSRLAAIDVPLAWVCKGFESAQSDASYGLLGHEIQLQVAPFMQAGVLSGPSFAQEVARGQPTALVAASAHAAVRQALVDAFHSPVLRVYASGDVIGVEVGGAVKNVLAIATGLCDGLNLGLNARAALITRGLAEMTRLGTALGAHAETFMGLSGLGDLVLTATGDLSRNRRVGLALAQGQPLTQVMNALGHVAEGVYTARTVVQRAHALGLEMPIAQAVVDLLDGRLQPQQAVQALMGRGPGQEF